MWWGFSTREIRVKNRFIEGVSLFSEAAITRFRDDLYHLEETVILLRDSHVISEIVSLRVHES